MSEFGEFNSVHAWRESRMADLAAAIGAIELSIRDARPDARDRLRRVVAELRERRDELRNRKLFPRQGSFGEYALEERARDRRAFFALRAPRYPNPLEANS